VKRMRFLALVGTAAATIAVGFWAAPASAATISVSGTVSCDGGNAVVGVWIQSSGGGSGFAAWTRLPNRVNVASYSKTLSTALPTNISLHVGCGGTSSSWWGDNWTPNKAIGGSATLNARCSEGPGTAVRCAWPATGASRSYNGFAGGYCTWGAAEKWKQNTGAYPGWNGDAMYWDTNARSAGWTVVSTPRARAVVVMEPGATTSSVGHVAWVNSYRISGSTIYLNITDMNRYSLGVWSTYERVYQPGQMSFIMAP